jgi:multidrug efflux pump subunit AcrA (membrane-fusion protein)
MYGRARFPVGAAKGLLVPKGAVMERGSLTSVWVVDRENVARLRLVKTGKERDGRIELLTGLSPGERIVTAGTERVIDGARIQ